MRSFCLPCTILNILFFFYVYLLLLQSKRNLIYLFQSLSSWFRQMFECNLLLLSLFILLGVTTAPFKKTRSASILKIFNIFFQIQFQPCLGQLKRFRPGRKLYFNLFFRHFHFSERSFIDFQYSQLIS